MADFGGHKIFKAQVFYPSNSQSWSSSLARDMHVSLSGNNRGLASTRSPSQGAAQPI